MPERGRRRRGRSMRRRGRGRCWRRSRQEKVPLPLKHTDVKGQVCGYIATVEVTQQFQNPFSEKIEAVYVFPLPENAAVNEFIMVIGERRIRGIIRERQEAEQIYREARRQGYVASLLTQERPNIFTQKVANIEPGKQIDVNIKYFNTLAYADGWYEFVFPMVVGPRFNPPGSHRRRRGGRPGQGGHLRPIDRSPVPQAQRAQRPRYLAGRRYRRRRQDRGDRLLQPRDQEGQRRLGEGPRAAQPARQHPEQGFRPAFQGRGRRRSNRPS